MAFWALEKYNKVKEIISNKEVSQKIKNYIPTHAQQHTESSYTSKKRQLSEAQMMELQLQSYNSLCALEQQIVKQMLQSKQQQYKKQQEMLTEQLANLNKELTKNISQYEKNKLMDEIRTGKKTIKQIVRQNILLKENLYKSQMQST